MSMVYEPKGKAREYSPLALNIYDGCNHGCYYCYVPIMFKNLRKSYYDESMHHKVTIPDFNYLDEVRRSMKKHYADPRQIMLCFTCDPYFNGDNSTTRKILEWALEYRLKIAILTKGGTRVLRDLDIFNEFAPGMLKVGMSMTFLKDDDCVQYERSTAIYSDRETALRCLHDNGIKTFVSFEPVIIHSDVLVMINNLKNIADHYLFGKMNYFDEYPKDIWYMFLQRAVDKCRILGKPFYIKESLRAFDKNNTIGLTQEETNPDYLCL